MRLVTPFLLASLAASGLAFAGPVPGLKTSETYQVTANGKAVWTEHLRSTLDIPAMPDWFTKGPHVAVPQDIHITDFEATGPVDIVVELPAPAGKVVLKPLSRGITPTIEGNRFSFQLPGPDKVYIEVEGHAPLALFANKPFPMPGSTPATFAFGPGTHEVGYLTLKDNDSVYLAPGAVVYGGIRASGAKNLRVYGGGILDGGNRFESMVKLEDCENIQFEGITTRNGIGWTNTLIRCRNVSYRGVKVISFGPAGDGIDPLNSSNVEISDSFFRCTDDCIAIKAPDYTVASSNIRIHDNTMVGFAYADGVTIGFELNAPSISNIEVWNCDVILARGGSMVQGHSGFSIICDGPARVHDILFRDIRVEQVEFKLFELQCTYGKHYGDDPPGNIENVTIRNVSWAHEAPIVLQGFSPENRVRQVRFENCTVAGKPLAQMKHLIRKNEFVEGVVISE
ncbi:MAG: glycosyl hydrolase family 28 protein [Opitutaceae bacterium]|nr:glycosyl hydrolase family 28 protein [Opitutaceae bacterium]